MFAIPIMRLLRSTIFRAMLFVMAACLLVVRIAYAQDGTAPASPLMPYVDLAATLGGFSALFAALINLAKYFHVLPDGDAGLASLVLNFGLLGLVIAGGAFGLNLTKFDSLAGSAASIVTTVLALLGQLIVTRAVHAGLKRTPIPALNHSFSRS